MIQAEQPGGRRRSPFGALRARVRKRREGSEYLRWARRVAIGCIGFTVLLLGTIMLVLPGPAVLVIPLGLAILATEFVWARRWVKRARGMISGMGKSVTPGPSARSGGLRQGDMQDAEPGS